MGTQKLWAQIVGVILILVGIIGFFNNPVLGIFGVDTLHNLVHIVTGLIFAWAGFARGAPTKKVNQWFGVIYLLVAILGFMGWITFMAINSADHWLHLLLGVVTILIGWFAD